MIRRIAEFLAAVISRWMPDAFVYTIVLTFIALGASLMFSPAEPFEVLQYWGDGVSSLLSFAMQMVLVIVAGHAIANSSPAIQFFTDVARQIHSTRQAAVVVTLFALTCNWLNPGFGLVASAFFATAIAKRLPHVNFPLLIAAGYSGYVIWHAGLSGSIPLKIASPSNDPLGSVISQAIPLSETVFSAPNLALCAILFLTLPALNMLMASSKNEESDEYPVAPENQSAIKTRTLDNVQVRPADKMEHSLLVGYSIAGLGVAYAALHFSTGKGLSLDMVILLLIITGLFLHGSPKRYVEAISTASPSAAGVILQYPFYGGIMGIMMGSGLTSDIAQWFVSVSTENTYLLFTFLSAGLLNIFVPSGGGQWVVQGPIVAESAAQLGKPVANAAMAVAYGDAWTNLIQPFWTLPILAVSGLSIRDIMGYCLVAFVWTGFVFASVLLLLY
ncbi:MAG: TIGR00366 family protein [Pseudomonadota bacterium]